MPLFLTSFLYDKYPEQIAQFIPHGEINSELISAFISPVKLDKDNQPSSSSVFPQSLTYRELIEAYLLLGTNFICSTLKTCLHP
jgi:hypothetical protein